MASSKSERIVRELLDLAEIEINGSHPWDIQVHDSRFYDRVLQQATLGLGESYMDGWWDCEAIDQFVERALRVDLEEKVKRNWRLLLLILRSRLLNLQAPAKAYEVGERHYDLGNDLYQAMLDKRLNYTCGYWRDATTLDGAQEAKLDLVCKKIGLKPGIRVLELGCGWGSFAKYAAERYGAQVLGVTVSKEQVELGMALCQGLPVELRLQDYREVDGTYDAVAPREEGNVNYKKDFDRLRHINLLQEGTFGELIDRLRALTHNDFRNAYFVDSSGKKIFVKISLTPEDSR